MRPSHLYAVPDPVAWPPPELLDLGERIRNASAYLCDAGNHSREDLGQAAADIVAAASRAEVLLRARVEVTGQLPLDTGDLPPWGEKWGEDSEGPPRDTRKNPVPF